MMQSICDQICENQTDLCIKKKSIIPHFCNPHTCIQVYVLAKFQCHVPRTFEVTALQDGSNRKIALYSKYRENKLQPLTKTDVSYKWIDVQT